MNFKEVPIVLIIGLMLMSLFVGVLIQAKIVDEAIHMDSRDLVVMFAECEKKLPRDINCKLIVVPDRAEVP